MDAGPDLSRLSPQALDAIANGQDPQSVITADAEQQAGVRPGLVGAILGRGERSAYNAKSPKGAVGTAQIMPGTAADLGVDPSDPVGSIYGAAQYTRQNLDRFNGDERLAVAAYNAGPGAVAKYGGVPPYAETRDYVHRVLGPDGSPTPAAGDPSPAGALPDVSNLTPAQLDALANGDMSVLGQGGAPVPTRPEAVNDPDGKISSADVPTAVSQAYRGLSINRGSNVGSKDNPLVNWAGSGRQPPAGSWVVDEGGLHQVLTPDQQKGLDGARASVAAAQPNDADKDAWKFIQGATFGFGDEGAGLASGVGAALQGKSFNDAYSSRVSALRESEAAFDQSHPVSSAGMSLAGAVANPLSAMGGEFVAGGRTLLPMIGRSALVGGGLGGLAAAGGANTNLSGDIGSDIGTRLKAGVGGAAGGAALGAVLPAGGAVLKRSTSALSETVQRALGVFGREGQEPTAAAIARATPDATDYVSGLVSRAKPDALTNPDLEAAGGTAAEALGRPAMTQLGAIARRDGQTGDLVESTMRQRAQALPQDVVDDFHEITGLDPAALAGNVAEQAANLRDKAAPLYQDAFSNPLGVSSTKLDDLARRPVVQEAMKRAVTIARNEGRYSDGLTTANVEAPPEPAQPKLTLDGPSFSDTLATVRSGQDPRVNSGPTILQYMARNGGVNDQGGELSALDGDLWHKDKPFMNRLVNPAGDSLDGWAQRLHDQGYFPDMTERPTQQHVIDAMGDELAGLPTYASQAAPRAVALKASADDMEDHLNHLGLDHRQMTDDEVAQALNPSDGGPHPYAPPDMVPAHDTAPTLQSWDDVKRGLDDIIESYRDGTTRKLNLDNDGRAAVDSVKQLRAELVRQRPEYGQALAAGGEPLQLEQAFNEAKRLSSNSVPERTFNARWNSYTPAQADGAKAGFLNGVYEDMRAGRLKLRDMQSPAMTAKMQTMFGSDQASALSGRLQARALLARTGARISPGNGSPTMEYQAAEKDRQDGMATLAHAAGRAVKGDFGSAVLKLATAPVMGAYRGAQVPLDRASRDVVGRMLAMRPSELDAFMAQARAREAAGRPGSPLRALTRRTGAASAGFLGSRPAVAQ